MARTLKTYSSVRLLWPTWNITLNQTINTQDCLLANLTNGLQGNVIFNSGRWVGYEGKDLDLTIDLGEVKPIRLISVRTLVSPSQWIMPHRGIWMWVSTDGKNFEDIYDLPAEPMPANKPDYIDTDNVLLPTAERQHAMFASRCYLKRACLLGIPMLEKQLGCL